MRYVLMLLTTSVLLMTSQFAQAESFWQKLNLKSACWPNQIGKCCPDDYRPKCQPYAKPACEFQCDVYCRKCEPCPKKVECFECEPYYKKCPPIQMKPNCAGLQCPLPVPCTTK